MVDCIKKSTRNFDRNHISLASDRCLQRILYFHTPLPTCDIEDFKRNKQFSISFFLSDGKSDKIKYVLSKCVDSSRFLILE